MDLYDKRVWGVCKDSAQDQLGAASLLWRLDLRNVPVADRWLDVANHVAPHIREHIQPFIDLHYIYALAKAGQTERVLLTLMFDIIANVLQVDEMLSSLEETASYARKQKEVALPLAKAVVNHAQGKYGDAYDCMRPIFDRTKEV